MQISYERKLIYILTFVCCALFVWRKYLVCGGEKEQRRKKGKYLEEKNILFHGGESWPRRKRRKILEEKYFSTEKKKNREGKYLEKENEWRRQPSNQPVEYNELSLFECSSIEGRDLLFLVLTSWARFPWCCQCFCCCLYYFCVNEMIIWEKDNFEKWQKRAEWDWWFGGRGNYLALCSYPPLHPLLTTLLARFPLYHAALRAQMIWF